MTWPSATAATSTTRSRSIARAARKLDAERLAREADAFAEALERDLIDADDFARPVER